MGTKYDELPRQDRTLRKELGVGKNEFKKYWFHVAYGPEALFERVRFKMNEPHDIKFSEHAVSRAVERKISETTLDKIRDFKVDEWDLKMASVSPVSLKFVDSTWERKISGSNIWVVIGLYATVESVYNQDDRSWGMDRAVRRGDPLYDQVDKVNRELMNKERTVGRSI